MCKSHVFLFFYLQVDVFNICDGACTESLKYDHRRTDRQNKRRHIRNVIASFDQYSLKET